MYFLLGKRLEKSLEQDWWIYGMQKDFLDMRHSLLSQFLYLFYPSSVYILWRTCNVWKSPIQRGSSSSPNYSYIFLLIAFLKEEFIRSIIVTLCVNYNMH